MSFDLEDLNPITAIIKGVGSIIDDVSTSDEERDAAKFKLAKLQYDSMYQMIEFEKTRLKAQSDIIVAEAKGDAWLQKSWRPITMLTLMAVVVLHVLGLTGENLTEAIWSDFYDLLKIGLGGYVVGRSGEKIMKNYKKNSDKEDG